MGDRVKKTLRGEGNTTLTVLAGIAEALDVNELICK